MLLMSNILLWENVASVPRHASGAGRGEMSLHGLLDHAIILAHNVTELIAEMNSVFVSTSLWLSISKPDIVELCCLLGNML